MILRYGFGESSYQESTRDLHHGKYDSPMAKYVAEACDGAIVGDAQEYECSDVDVDYYALIGRRRVYHVDSRGFHYLWRYATEEEARADFVGMTEHLRWSEEDEDDVVLCGTCQTIITSVVEPHAAHWVDEDGDSLSYVPTLHDHSPHEPGGLLDEIRQAEREIGTI